MQQLFSYVAVVILVLLSVLHFYWLFGGTWGVQLALPEKVEGGTVFTPRRLEMLVVALGLMGMAVLLIVQLNALAFFPASSFTKWASILVAFIFLLRAIGDFKYLGLFKKIKDTTFARYDTKLYTPLCLFLSSIFMMAGVF